MCKKSVRCLSKYKILRFGSHQPPPSLPSWPPDGSSGVALQFSFWSLHGYYPALVPMMDGDGWQRHMGPWGNFPDSPTSCWMYLEDHPSSWSFLEGIWKESGNNPIFGRQKRSPWAYENQVMGPWDDPPRHWRTFPKLVESKFLLLSIPGVLRWKEKNRWMHLPGWSPGWWPHTFGYGFVDHHDHGPYDRRDNKLFNTSGY